MEINNSENDENIIKVGIKPFMNYVTALKIQIDKNDEVYVYARGKFISKAFDIIEVCKRNFLKDMKIKYGEFKIVSVPFKNGLNNKEIFVSTIEIKLIKEGNGK
jgi:DNA-binding protein Alba